MSCKNSPIRCVESIVKIGELSMIKTDEIITVNDFVRSLTKIIQKSGCEPRKFNAALNFQSRAKSVR